MIKRVLPSREKLNSLYDYDTGNPANPLVKIATGSALTSAPSSIYASMTINGVSYQTHRVVWQWHYGDAEVDGVMVIDHIDENKHNNLIENLQQITNQENVIRSLRIKDGGVVNIHTTPIKYLTSEDLHTWFEEDLLDKSAEIGVKLNWRTYSMVNAGWTIATLVCGIPIEDDTYYLLADGRVCIGTDTISCMSLVVAFKVTT